MNAIALSTDQRDALQEIVNIAMGRAGALLAQVLNTFVLLSVPRIQTLVVEDVPEAISKMVGANKEVTAVRQAFQGYMRGEAIVIFNQKGCGELADLMGYDSELDADLERELLLDVTNILVGACLCGTAEQLSAELSFSAPSLMAERVVIERLIEPAKMTWTHSLLVEVNFSLEEKAFTSHLMTLMPEGSILKMAAALDTFLENF